MSGTVTSLHDTGMIERITSWVRNRRAAAAEARELAAIGGNELSRLADDVGAPSADALLNIVRTGPNGSALLAELAAVLGIPLESLRESTPLLVRDLEASCCRCGDKRRCAHDLREGVAAEHFAEYCPNAEALAGLRP